MTNTDGGRTSGIHAWALDGLPEIVTGADLAALITAHLDRPLCAYDVVVVTSKVVSKAAGLTVAGDREALIDRETDRIVARRGATRIVRTHHGLTMAAAGLDASNTAPGTVVVLPPDPDADAAALRDALLESHPHVGGRLGVVVTDTAGRPWRTGQTDVAIGVAGITPVTSLTGRDDAYGNTLAVTAPAIADEIAGAAELVAGKLTGAPVAIVRGLGPELFTVDDGPGAASLIRHENEDLFGFGANEAVRQAVDPDGSRRGFADVAEDLVELATLACAPVDADVLDVGIGSNDAAVTIEIGRRVAAARDDAAVELGTLLERVRVLGRAYGFAVAHQRTGDGPLPSRLRLVTDC